MKKVFGAVIVAGLALTGGAAYYIYKTSANSGADTTINGGRVLATVDGYRITETEISPMMRQGVDKAIALDRKITQSVIAKAAEGKYKQEAEILVQATRNDILYQLYVTKRADELRKAITEQDVSSYYQKNVKDEDYKSAVIKIHLTSDAREAQGLFEAVSAGGRDAEAAIGKMSYMQKEGDHYLPLQALPYNLGQLVKKMKPGQVLQPIVIREGVLVAYVENIKAATKPTLDGTKEEIRGLLVNERLSTEIQDLRKKAAIELKG